MTTPWSLRSIGPLGDSLKSYDRTQPPQAQDESTTKQPTIDQTFIDAMIVREEVFVTEQGVPLQNELDDDDAECIHFVLYCSSADGIIQPSGTIRIVPQSTSLHVDLDQHRKLDGTAYVGDVKSSTYTGEPFIKLGRLAVTESQRGRGHAASLVRAALEYAVANPLDLGAGTEKEAQWHGLVLIHAQMQVQKFWASCGFTVDEAFGMWDEEGIDHIAMWKRMQVPGADL